MEYSFWKGLWKGLRPVLVGGVLAGLTAVAQQVDVATLTSVGVPSAAAFIVVEVARNWAKQRAKQE